MAKKIIGLDLKKDTVSAVIIDTGFQGSMIEAFDEIPLTISPIAKTTENQEDNNEEPTVSKATISEVLEILKTRYSIENAQCYMTYPVDDIYFRNVDIPFKGDKKVRQVVPFELEPTLPVPVSGLITDVIEINLPGDQDITRLVTISTDKPIIESTEKEISDAGMEPRLITMDAYPVSLCLSLFGDFGDDYIHLDIDSSLCRLFIIFSKQIMYIRSFPTRKNEGIISEIKRTLAAFSEQYDFAYKPSAIAVSGKNKADIDHEAMQKAFEISVVDTDVVALTGINLEESVKHKWKSDTFDNALAVGWCGLTGSDCMKFSESGFSPKKFVAEYRKQIQGPAVLFAILFCLFVVQVFTGSFTSGSKVEGLEAQMKAIYLEVKPDAKAVNINIMKNDLQGYVRQYKKTSDFSTKANSNIKVIDMLNEISKAIPDKLDVEINRFVLGKEDIQIQGMSDGFASINDMTRRLEKIKIFRKVIPGSSSQDKKSGKYRFKVKIEI